MAISYWQRDDSYISRAYLVEDMSKFQPFDSSRFELATEEFEHPLLDVEEVAFTELFDLADIQQLQDQFALATGVASIITEVDGTPITRPSSFCRLCDGIIRRTEKGLRNCQKSDACIGRHHPEGPVVQPCLSGGLWDAGASITVGGRHIANWLIGQVRNEAQDEARMADYAREIGVDEAEFLEAFREVPAMSEEQFRRIAQALFTLAGQLSQRAYQSLQQSRYISDQLQAELAIRESEERMRTLFESANDAICLLDMQQIIDCNQRMVEMFGCDSKRDIVGRSITEFCPDLQPDGRPSHETALERIEAALVGRTKFFEWRHKRYDGSEFDVEVSLHAVETQGQMVLQAIVRDVTERNRAMEAVNRSENLLRTTLENAPVVLFSLDTEGIFQLSIGAGLRSLGLRPGEAVGRSVFDLYKDSPETLDVIRSAMDGYTREAVLEVNGLVWETRFSPIRDDSGRIAGLVCVSTDVTERKKAEERTEHSISLLKATLESTEDAIWVVDLNGKMVTCNSRMAELWQTPESVLATGDDQKALDHVISMVADPEAFIQGVELLYARPDTESFDTIELVDGRMLERYSRPQRIGDKAVGRVWSFRDVTVRKRAQEKIVQNAAHLEKVNEDLVRRNGELDEFTYVASHDLQEPLRKLTAFSGLLKKDAGDALPASAAKDLEFITDAASRMQLLIQDLLNLSRAGRKAMAKELVSLDRCLNGALDSLAVRIQETGAVIEREEMGFVFGDRTMLTQLFQNLVGNALKFVANRKPIIRISGSQDGTLTTVHVRDNGIGIKPEYCEQVFAPFKRLHGRGEYEGSGIGLSICRKTVERHGGKIWVESVPGEGSTFCFTIDNQLEEYNAAA